MRSTLGPVVTLAAVLVCAACTSSETAAFIAVGEPPSSASPPPPPGERTDDLPARAPAAPSELDIDVFIERYCARFRDMCWRHSIDIETVPPDTDPSVCAATLRALSQAPGTTCDMSLAKICEREDFWTVSFPCGGVFKVAQPRAAGSKCSVDAECGNHGDAVGLCIAASDGRRCALVRRGNLGDACIATSGSPLEVRSTFDGAICMHQEGLFCDPSGRCAARRKEGEGCRRDPRPAGSSVDCEDGLWCIDGSCVSRDALVESGVYCPPDAEISIGCGRPIGDECDEYLLASVPVSDCLGQCMAGRCTDWTANPKAAACMGFTTAHSFDF